MKEIKDLEDENESTNPYVTAPTDEQQCP